MSYLGFTRRKDHLEAGDTLGVDHFIQGGVDAYDLHIVNMPVRLSNILKPLPMSQPPIGWATWLYLL